jgi:hypothetical protein
LACSKSKYVKGRKFKSKLKLKGNLKFKINLNGKCKNKWLTMTLAGSTKRYEVMVDGMPKANGDRLRIKLQRSKKG